MPARLTEKPCLNQLFWSQNSASRGQPATVATLALPSESHFSIMEVSVNSSYVQRLPQPPAAFKCLLREFQFLLPVSFLVRLLIRLTQFIIFLLHQLRFAPLC